MKGKGKEIAVMVMKAILLAAFKVAVFGFWVLSSAVLVLLKELNESARRYLFNK